ncbi:MAG: aldolase [Methanotrichaceae archaeon]|nr:aldolase [Methanotrichaceae archaeon]
MSLDWQEIARFGRKIVSAGLTSSRFGNISVLHDDRIIITCTGSMLDELDEAQVVEIDIIGPCPLDRVASSETCVHRAIYQSTSAKAVIHTHSPYAVALSLIEKTTIEPVDSEGKHFLGSLPVVEGSFGSEDLAESVSTALRFSQACIARGHGVFAAGRSLAEAYTAAAMAEHSSQVRYLVQNDRSRRSDHGGA